MQRPPPASPSGAAQPETSRSRTSALWFWTKVVLCLVALDLLLFGSGLFWRIPIQWRAARGGSLWVQAYLIARQIDTAPKDEPLVVALGSSVVGQSLNAGTIERRMHKRGVPGDFANLAMDGSSATDVALVAHGSRRLDPWLVIYGAEARDFHPEHQRTPLNILYRDSGLPLPIFAQPDLEERIGLFVKSHWRLYRYRPLVRIVLRQEANRVLAWSAAVAQAAPGDPEPRSDASSEAETEPGKGKALEGRYALWRKWLASRDFADYEAYLGTVKGGITLANYRHRIAHPFDVESSPQLESYRWMLAHYQRRDTPVVVALLPENPVFLDPKAAHLFDPAFSDRAAAMLEREATRFGAGFVDLRTLLPAEDFIDLLHLNDGGRAKLAARIARLIIEEWRARARDETEPPPR